MRMPAISRLGGILQGTTVVGVQGSLKMPETVVKPLKIYALYNGGQSPTIPFKVY
jgi:hypothetical protein